MSCPAQHVAIRPHGTGERKTLHGIGTVMVEARDASVDKQALKTDLERRMKEVLGIRVTVEIHGGGELDGTPERRRPRR